MNAEEALKRFETQLTDAGFHVRRVGVNPISFCLVCAGQNVGQIKIWAPLKPKFNEVHDRWRDAIKGCWVTAQQESSPVARGDGGHWREVDQLLAHFEPYREDFLDFEDLANAVIAALRADRVRAPDLDTLQYDFSAIERAAKSRGK
jgi:hypothetical protein